MTDYKIYYVSRVIKAIRESDRFMIPIFTNGGCYKFYLILKAIFPDAEPYMNKDKTHVVAKIYNRYFDIKGDVNPDSPNIFYFMTDEDIALAETWEFGQNYELVDGVCDHCEEPVKMKVINM